MTIAFRSHLNSHEMASQAIGAGLIRNTCLVCDHISLSDDVERSAVGTAVTFADCVKQKGAGGTSLSVESNNGA